MAEETFVWGSGGSKDSIDRRRRIAEALMLRGSDTSPVQHWTQGLARVADAITGRMEIDKLDKDAKAGQKALAGDFAEASSLPAGTAAASASPAGGKVDIGPATFNEVAPRLMSDLKRDFGINDMHAAAIAGNLGHESAGFGTMQEVNPVVPGSRGGFGYAQWTGPRRVAFESWAKANGLDPNGYAANYGFLRHELANTGEGKVLEALKAAQDPQTATRIFSEQFLRPGVPGMGSRQKWTQRALAFAPSADRPAPGAKPVGAETGVEGFFIPPGPAGEGLPIMQPGGALPNFDQDTGRWTGPSTPPALAAQTTPANAPAEAAAPEAPAPLPPVFMSEGTSQPWMGSAIMPAPPAPQTETVSAPLPPSRPANLPMADIPAPGARVAQAMVTPALPAMQPDLSNENDGGSRAFAASGGGANTPVSDNATIFDRIVSAMGGRAAPAASAPSPGVERVAAAMPAAAPASAAAPSPGVARVAAAMPEGNTQLAAAQRILNSPYANPGQRAVAQAVVERAIKGADMETITRPDGSVWRAPKTGGGAPVQVFGPQSKPAEPGSQVQVFRDDKTGEIVAVDKTKVGAGAGSDVVRPGKPRPDDNMDAEGKLRNEFSGRVKEFGTVQDAYGRIVASVQNRIANPQEKSPASDIALVFGYMKMLDPGSVVREGEYATAQNAAGIPERVRNYYNKAIDGEFLDPKQRDDMVATAGRLYKQARGTASAEGKRYRDLATSYGLNPDRIVALPDEIVIPKTAVAPAPAAGAAGAPAAPGAVAAPKSKAEYDALPRGTPYIDPNGQPRTKP
jgi:hypothetical protein